MLLPWPTSGPTILLAPVGVARGLAVIAGNAAPCHARVAGADVNQHTQCAGRPSAPGRDVVAVVVAGRLLGGAGGAGGGSACSRGGGSVVVLGRLVGSARVRAPHVSHV